MYDWQARNTRQIVCPAQAAEQDVYCYTMLQFLTVLSKHQEAHTRRNKNTEKNSFIEPFSASKVFPLGPQINEI
jgi:hypothetical protein